MNGIDTLITEFETVAGYHSAIGSFLFDRMPEINSQKTSTGDSDRVYPLLLIDSDQTTGNVNRSLNSGLPKRKEYSVRVILCDEYDQTEQATTDLEAKFEEMELTLHQYLAKVYRRSTENFTKIIIDPESLENDFVQDHGADKLLTVAATVTAYVDSGNCDNGTFTDLPNPLALSATSGSASVDLSWTDNSSTEDGFQIWRSTSLSTGFTLLTTTAADATTYSDTSGTLDQTYFYKVRAIDGTAISSYSNTVAGTRYSAACADATAVLKDTAGATISSTGIASGASADIEAPDGSVRVQYVNGTLIENVTVKSNGSETSNVPNPTTPINTSNPIKTGQTTSYAAGDDGDLEEGRLTDFTTLDFTNVFGNTNRFTDELGGQTYANNIVIDHSTYNQNSSAVLGLQNTNNSRVSWSAAITNASATSISTYSSGWRLWNIKEAFNFMFFGSGATRYGYTPLSTIDGACWCSTTDPSNSSNAYNHTDASGYWASSPKTFNRNWVAVRTFTWNGTALT